jgi:hypothetical protein
MSKVLMVINCSRVYASELSNWATYLTDPTWHNLAWLHGT